MNLTTVEKNKEQLLSYMRLQHFSENYVIRHRQMSDFIAGHMDEYSWRSFSDIKEWLVHQPYSKRYAADFLKILRNIETFHQKGFFPGNGAIHAALKEEVPSCGHLDLSYLQNHLEELLSFMRSNDYSEEYIRCVRFVARRIIVLSRSIPWNTYKDILEWYQDQGLKPSYLKNIVASLGILEAFHLRNEMPNNRETPNALCLRDNAYEHLSSEYRGIVDFAINQYEQKSLKQSTILGIKSAASSFLLYIQKAGAYRLELIDSYLAFSYFQSEAVRVNGKGVSLKLRKFFKDCIPYSEECRRIMFLIPLAPSGRRNIQYITEEEGLAFISALTDLENGLSFKARAIGSILYYTGMRSSDIANLRLDSIDLQQQVINITQVKTGKPLTLPLTPVVGNSIYDYCTNERPSTDSPYLFVGNQAPHHKVGTGAIYIAVSSIMDIVGIRMNPGDRRGTHIFRHRAATTMMENNIPPAIISQTLGHCSPQSLDPYLYADKVHLKECALSLAAFPIGMEVFASV